MAKKYLDDTGLSTLASEISSHFQAKLTAGTNITIDANNVISAVGGGTDTGATSITTTGSGNAVTSASYDASTRQITLTKGSTFLKTAPVTSVAGHTGAVSASSIVSAIISTLIGTSNRGASSGTISIYTGQSGNYAYLQICFGRGDYGNSNEKYITFNKSFSVVPIVSFAWQKYDNTTREYNVKGDVGTAGFTARKNSGDSSNYYLYIAIGWSSSKAS